LAVGPGALKSTTFGAIENVALGINPLQSTTTGSFNTAMGSRSLTHNTTGGMNTGVGAGALQVNTTGDLNTALGQDALGTNTTGAYNTALGVAALYENGIGSYNTALGTAALFSNTSGVENIAVGYHAGSNLTSGSSNIHIGNNGSASDDSIIRIGTGGKQAATFIAGISGVNVSGVPVLVSGSGQLGVTSSSRRFKQDIEDMGDATSNLKRLRPVTYRYKQPFEDGSQPIQYGLIAEEVAEVYPELVAHSADGKIETVKYQILDSMLLNELQKQNATITVQREEIQSLKDRLSRLESLLEKSFAAQ
jgi:hypothetical protein